MSCSGSTTCGMTNPVSFDAIAGKPIKYGSPGDYDRRMVQAETSFYNELENWVGTLGFYSDVYGGPNFNDLQWFGHAGAYVCKDGCHGRGRAFDLNRVVWNGYVVDMFNGDHASSSRSVRRRYLAVSASCRWEFKYVLDGFYNDAAHDNHIHMDTHTAPLLNKQHHSDAGFVQAVCNNFNNAGLTIDTEWGPATQAAWVDLNQAWSYNANTCDPFNSVSGYREWLSLVMKHGFDDVAAGTYTSSAC